MADLSLRGIRSSEFTSIDNLDSKIWRESENKNHPDWIADLYEGEILLFFYMPHLYHLFILL
jgi:hypothetical protein